MAPPLSSERSYIEALDPRLRVLDGGAAYLSELQQKGVHSRRQLPEGTRPASKAERDRLLQSAEVVVVSHPVLPDLRARAPQLRWLHHVQAGVSNLWGTDVWDSDVTLTTARGVVGTTSIAEFVMAGVLYFARGLHDSAAAKAQGQLDRTTRQRMIPVQWRHVGHHWAWRNRTRGRPAGQGPRHEGACHSALHSGRTAQRGKRGHTLASAWTAGYGAGERLPGLLRPIDP